MPSALAAFTDDLAVFHERFGTDVHGLDAATEARLAALVREPGFLPPEACVGSLDRYRQHILHVARDRSHSVVSLVRYPGQRTPIHDHVSWCVVGVHEGTESQALHHLAFLFETGEETAGPGSCSSLVPSAENIHCVANAGSVRAVSMHVDGADIERLVSSINRTFDRLPVRGLVGTSRRAWRRGS